MDRHRGLEELTTGSRQRRAQGTQSAKSNAIQGKWQVRPEFRMGWLDQRMSGGESDGQCLTCGELWGVKIWRRSRWRNLFGV